VQRVRKPAGSDGVAATIVGVAFSMWVMWFTPTGEAAWLRPLRRSMATRSPRKTFDLADQPAAS
jgi:hypothetical protein